MLVAGLAIGLLGSFADDLLGTGTVVAVLQVVLWIACAALLIPGLVALRARGGATRSAGRLSRTAA